MNELNYQITLHVPFSKFSAFLIELWGRPRGRGPGSRGLLGQAEAGTWADGSNWEKCPLACSHSPKDADGRGQG